MYTVYNKYKMTSLEELCIKKFIDDGRGLKGVELDKHLMGLHMMPKSVFVNSDLFEKLITIFSDKVLQYIANEIKLIPKHVSILKKQYISYESTYNILKHINISEISTECIKQFIQNFEVDNDLHLATNVLKLPQIDNETIKLLINITYPANIMRLTKIIPKEYFNDEIIKLLIYAVHFKENHEKVNMCEAIPRKYCNFEIMTLIKKKPFHKPFKPFV